MARSFTSTDNILTTAFTAANTGSWTIGCWMYQTAAQQGQLVVTTDNPVTTSVQQFRIENGNPNLRAIQIYAGTLADSVTSTSFAINKWWAVFATFNSADSKCRIYYGDLAAAVAEAAYTTQDAGTSTRTTNGTRLVAGSNSAFTIPFAGSISRQFFDARLWTTDEMEMFRLGMQPVQTGTLRNLWLLDSPTAAQAEDLSGMSVNGTVTGTTVTENPPIPWNWLANQPTFVTVTAAAVAAEDPYPYVGGGYYPTEG